MVPYRLACIKIQREYVAWQVLEIDDSVYDQRVRYRRSQLVFSGRSNVQTASRRSMVSDDMLESKFALALA